MENLNGFESISLNDSLGYLKSNFALSSKEKKQVDIWICEINKHENLLQFDGYLSNEEKLKSSKFKFQGDKNHFIITHVFLRIILSKYLETEASLLEFKYGENNKPYLGQCSSKCSFNISKTKDLAVVAIGTSGKVGVDIERIEPDFDYSEIIVNYFSQKEQESIKSSLENIANTQFFYLWTRKEALVKALGVGLDCDLKEMEVVDEKVVLQGQRGALSSSFNLSSFILDTQYVLSIARDDSSQNLKFFNGLGQLTKWSVENLAS